MSHEWNALLPDLNAEFTDLTLRKRAPTPEEERRLKELLSLAEGNCQAILYGLAAAGAAVTAACEANELTPRQIGHFASLVRYLSTLGDDLAHLEGCVAQFLERPSQEVFDADA